MMEKKEKSPSGLVRYLDPAEISFVVSDGAAISLVYRNKTVSPVTFYRAFPYAAPSEHISVRDGSEEEIGLIRNLDELSDSSAACVRKELARRYFAPEIVSISSMTEKSGHVYWDVITSAGNFRFSVKCGSHCLRPIPENRYLVSDVEGNRFELKKLDNYPAKFRKTIESLL